MAIPAYTMTFVRTFYKKKVSRNSAANNRNHTINVVMLDWLASLPTFLVHQHGHVLTFYYSISNAIPTSRLHWTIDGTDHMGDAIHTASYAAYLHPNSNIAWQVYNRWNWA